jgi:hypothetical protein
LQCRANRERLYIGLSDLSNGFEPVIAQASGKRPAFPLERDGYHGAGPYPEISEGTGTVRKSAGMEKEVCQLKVTLRSTRPPIWRRLLVPADATLTRLHRVLQIAMGWQDSHMHEFRVDERRPAIRSARIGDVLTEIGSSLSYTYDLGDGWEHSIVLEKRFSGGDDAERAVCLDGQQACPPEDCGGVPGYYDLLEVLRNPDDERYDEMREWIGEDFDPQAFSVEGVNRQLRAGRVRGRSSM